MDDYDGPTQSSGEEDFDSSLQTQPLTPPVPDTSTGSYSQPPANPPKSADIPPDPAPQPFQTREPLVQWAHVADSRRASCPAMAINPTSRIGTLARGIRTFYQKAARWDPEGKPSVGL